MTLRQHRQVVPRWYNMDFPPIWMDVVHNNDTNTLFRIIQINFISRTFLGFYFEF